MVVSPSSGCVCLYDLVICVSSLELSTTAAQCLCVTGSVAVLSFNGWSGRDQPVADKCPDISRCLVVCVAAHSTTEGQISVC